MAASDSCVPNLCADVTDSHANARETPHGGLLAGIAATLRPSADLLSAATCTFLIYSLSGIALSLRQRMIMSIVVGIVATFSRIQQEELSISNLNQIRETESVLRSTALSQLIVLSVNLVLGIHLRAWTSALFLFAMASSMLAMRAGITLLLRRVHRAGYGAAPVVIYGHPDTTKQIAAAMLRSPSCGLHPAAIIHDESAHAVHCMFRAKDGFCSSIPISSGPLTSAKLNSFQCNLLILAAPHLSQEEIAVTANIARECGAPVGILSASSESEEPLERIEIDGLHLVTRTRMLSAGNSDLLKRAMDISVALFLMIAGLPILLFIAACIKLDSRGPVLFIQKRVGRSGELFNIFKFRSMRSGSSMYEASPTAPTDPRITRVGRILRRTGLDETPQLINVLLGQMSLVGPRPEMPFLVEGHIRAHRPRLRAIPGITGLWQLSTDRAFPIHQNTHYDLYYIRNRTCWMDAAILLHTMLFAMRGGI
ncbi:MAG TPA: sugar transferase [Acidobacteriaceae bacterium]|nr:sugar transferase [Acidobacteriaceae bacterium]